MHKRNKYKVFLLKLVSRRIVFESDVCRFMTIYNLMWNIENVEEFDQIVTANKKE